MRKRTLWYLLFAVLCCAVVVGATQVKKAARWNKHAPSTLARAPQATKMHEPGQITVAGKTLTPATPVKMAEKVSG